MHPSRSSSISKLGACSAILLCALLASGCATQSLNSARHNFYSGQFDRAEDLLSSEETIPERNRVLFLMERGMVRQMQGEYDESTDDFIAAYERLRELETYSLSRGAGSLVINDNIQDFVGYPYERTLLHAYTAKNHIASGRWNDTGVEARRIIHSLSEDSRRKYPDEPYSRYLSALILELTGDTANSEMQYRLVDEQVTSVNIDPRTGRLAKAKPRTGNGKEDNEDADAGNHDEQEVNPQEPIEYWDRELVVFIQLGRSARPLRYSEGTGHTYAEIHSGGQYLGRSYTLSDTTALARKSEDARAALSAAKTAGRFVVKESIAAGVESGSDHIAGDLVRLVLFGLLERPDNRRWETLPRRLQVARVPIQGDIDSYDIVLKDAQGDTIRTITVNQPMNRYRNTYISFFRDRPMPGYLMTRSGQN